MLNRRNQKQKDILNDSVVMKLENRQNEHRVTDVKTRSPRKRSLTKGTKEFSKGAGNAPYVHLGGGRADITHM